MKALLLTNLYPSHGAPTRGLFNLNTYGALARRCDVRVVTPVRWWNRRRRPQEWLTVPVEDWTGLTAYLPTYWPIPHYPRSHVWSLYTRLRRYVPMLRREFAFDILIVAMAYPEGTVAAMLARDLNCALVSNVLGSDVNELAQRPGLRREVAWGLKQAHRVIAVSSALADRAIELGVDPDRVVVQRNAVDGERFRIRDRDALRDRLGVPAVDRVVLCVGNLLPEKGPLVLLQAFARLVAKADDPTRLVLIGDGTLRGALRRTAASLGVDGHVQFCGALPNSEVADWLGASDVLCLPSYREGCPNVVLEALASGRPVVASAVGGVPEMLSAKTGVLVSPGDPDALARGLECALEASWNPEALRASVDALSWDRVGDGYYAALLSALEEWKRTSSGRRADPERSPAPE